MTSSKRVCVLAIACLTVVSAFSISHTTQSKGRKLFGGYRIVPKVCQPTNPSRLKSNEPPICMFNYECSRRRGEVVGACMDGFLFGACCQLPPKDAQNSLIQANNSPSNGDDIDDLHEIDHVPEIPILLNPDGSPMGISLADIANAASTTTKFSEQAPPNAWSNPASGYTKITTLSPDGSTSNVGNSPSVDLTKIQADYPVLLGNHEILNDLRLPGLITHSNNDIQDHQSHSPVNPVTTLLSPDQILQIADPIDQLPALFAQGLGQNNHTGADTVLLNVNGTRLDEKHNPDDYFKPQNPKDQSGISVETTLNFQEPSQTPPTASTMRYSSKGQSSSTSTTPAIQQYANVNRLTTTSSRVKYTSKIPASTASTEKKSNSPTIIGNRVSATTPMSTTSQDDDDSDLVRVPTITYDVQSGNKKNDILDREEIAINHIISILNATTPSAPTRVTQKLTGSSVHTWVSIDETAKPSVSRQPGTKVPTTLTTTTEMFPYTYYKPGRPSTYYHYDTPPTHVSGSSSFSTPSSSTGSSRPYTTPKPGSTSKHGNTNSYDYSTRPSINPPAPTVIVLGPLGTEYTTITTKKPLVKKPTNGPIKPSLVTKSPTIATTITHNISTVISTSSASTSNNHVVSTSYISVNLKDNTSPRPSERPTIHNDVESEAFVIGNTPSTKKPSTIWTTLSAWSGKPSFHPKPAQSEVIFPDSSQKPIYFKETTTNVPTKDITTATQASTTCDDETPAPDDLINFPPVRNPNLTQPALIQTFNDTDFSDIDVLNGNDIPTPSFIEDEVLTNKVEVFVHNIVESLNGNFNDLEEVVYSKKNITSASPAQQIEVPTRKPTIKRPTAKPSTGKPSQVTTRKPGTKKPTRPPGSTLKPTTEKPIARPTKTPTSKPRPSASSSPTTKKPISTVTKRPKPPRKPTVSTTTTTTTTTAATPETIIEDTGATVVETIELAAEVPSTTPDYRTECGVRPLIKTGRIVGGKGASFGEWPWQVLVREATWLGLFTKNKCGGVLVTNSYVITAAHCQPGFLATLVAVFGEFDISGELESRRSITRNVRRVVVNRAYNPATFENDLALLELEKPVQFDAHIVPICMPDDNADFTGRMATVTGWGRVKYNGGTPSVLQEVQVPIMENAVCQEMFRTAGHSKLILDSFLCAGYASGQKDSCEGDSGGPLMMEGSDGRWILVGTVSHGIKCAAPYLPGVYMRTTFFKPWLHSVTGV